MCATAAIRTLLAGLLTCLAAASLSDVVRAEGPAGEVGVNVNGEPRFVVKALNFQAFDETGFDFLGSDEVVFTFGTRRYVIVSNEFGRINSDGEVHPFEPSENCIAPAVDNDGHSDHAWQCSNEGVTGPLSFLIGAYEQDSDPLDFLVCFFTLCQWGGNFAVDQDTGTDLRPADFVSVAAQYPNHLIGKEDVQISLATLLAKLPQVGRSFTKNVVLLGACDLSKTTSPCKDNEPLYNVVVEITRVNNTPALPVNPHP